MELKQIKMQLTDEFDNDLLVDINVTYIKHRFNEFYTLL